MSTNIDITDFMVNYFEKAPTQAHREWFRSLAHHWAQTLPHVFGYFYSVLTLPPCTPCVSGTSQGFLILIDVEESKNLPSPRLGPARGFSRFEFFPRIVPLCVFPPLGWIPFREKGFPTLSSYHPCPWLVSVLLPPRFLFAGIAWTLRFEMMPTAIINFD